MLDETGLWQDLLELPDALAATLDARDGVVESAALLGASDVRRVVVSGNGAAYYVAVALWLASLEGAAGAEVVAVPSGLLARGSFRWRPGDRLLAVSSSGEFRDLVEAVETAPQPYVALTANAGSTLGSGAGERALVRVLNQRAVTHTQAFCGGVAVALSIWAELTGDVTLGRALAVVPQRLAGLLDATQQWLEAVGEIEQPSAGIAFGSGPGWASALEAALLLKEVAGVPAEGVETREGATSAMMALRPGNLALSLPTGADPLLDEAEQSCRSRGATVLRAPSSGPADRRLAPITSHAPAAALSGRIGLGSGLDVDRPAWTDDYYRVARSAG